MATSGGTASLAAHKDIEVEPYTLIKRLKIGLFTIVLFLSIVERLSRTANLLSIERDWIPAMAAPIPISDGESSKNGLTELNAVMSRIDLICKLLSPIVFSAFTTAVGSVRVVIVSLLILNAVMWPAEIWSATRVWKLNRRLKEPKVINQEGIDLIDSASETPILNEQECNIIEGEGARWQQSRQRIYQAIQRAYNGATVWFIDYKSSIQIYFAYSVWLPSIALSTLHFSVLNYSPTLSVYLLSSGFTLNHITLAKALSAIAELASTLFTPWGVWFARKKWEGGETKDPDIRDDDPSGFEASMDPLLEPNAGQQDVQTESGIFAPETDMGVAVLGFCALIQMGLSLVSI
jgi:iron-regulated transporter 1